MKNVIKKTINKLSQLKDAKKVTHADNGENLTKTLSLNSLINFSPEVYCEDTFKKNLGHTLINKIDIDENIDSARLASLFNYIIRYYKSSDTNSIIDKRNILSYIIQHWSFDLKSTFKKDFGDQSWIEICIVNQDYWLIQEAITYSISECDNDGKMVDKYYLFENVGKLLDIIYSHFKKSELISQTSSSDPIFLEIMNTLSYKRKEEYATIKKFFYEVIFNDFPYEKIVSKEERKNFNLLFNEISNVYGKKALFEVLNDNKNIFNSISNVKNYEKYADNIEKIIGDQPNDFYFKTLIDSEGNNIMHYLSDFPIEFINKIVGIDKDKIELFFIPNNQVKDTNDESIKGYTPFDNLIKQINNKDSDVNKKLSIFFFNNVYFTNNSKGYSRFSDFKENELLSLDKNNLLSDLFNLKIARSEENKVYFIKRELGKIKEEHHLLWKLYEVDKFIDFIELRLNENMDESNIIRFADKSIMSIKEDVIYEIIKEKDLIQLKENSSTKEDRSIYKVWSEKIKAVGGKRILASNSKIKGEMEQLRSNFPNFSNYIDFIEDNIYLNDLSRGYFHLPPSLLLSEPGIGKTFFLSEFSSKIGTYFDIINMESVHAGFSLIGGASLYIDSDVGRIFKNMHASAYANPIMVLDEIDKISKTHQSPVEPVLLPLLEEHTAKNFRDEFIEICCDISKVVWVATANDLSSISEPIQSRFEIHNIPSPNFDERKILAQNIYKKVLKDMKCEANFNNDLSHEVLSFIAQDDKSSRTMRKDLTKALAKAARKDRKEIIVEDVILTSIKNRVGF